MATVLQTPDALSLLRNMKSFIIESASEISFTLAKGGTTVLAETYYPDANNRIEIDVADVISEYLSTVLPTSNAFAQTSAVATFSAAVGGTSAGSFTVVNGGVRKLSDTASNFLTANWLTWQPQVKQVTWDGPEYLSYYFQASGTIKAKFYKKNGNTSTVTLRTQSATGVLLTLNTTFSRLVSVAELDPADIYGLVDIWVADGATQKSYVQRYVCTETMGDEHCYLCVNSLGGIDTFTFHGDCVLEPEVAHESAKNGEVKIDITSDAERRWRQNTGYAGIQATKWWFELLSAARQWAVMDGNAEPIVIDTSSLQMSDRDNLHACTFDYTLCEEGRLLNISRTSGALPVIAVPSPGGELFFLNLRLADYPDADLEDTILFLVQSPYTEQWSKTSLAALREWLMSVVIASPIGLAAHTHDNKPVLDYFGETEDHHPTYRGEPLTTGGDSEAVFELLQSLQAQIDSVASRCIYDELTTAAMFADMAAIDALYVHEIELDGYSLAGLPDILRHLSLGESSHGLPCIISDIGISSIGFVTAGGTGDSGGGGGGADLLDVWDSLQSTTGDYGTWKIANSHMPSLVATGGLTAQYATNSQTGANLATTLTIGVDIGYKLPTLQEWNNITGTDLSVVSDCLQSLQAQIDSVASRCIYDELTAAAMYADMLAASAGYIGQLETSGITLGGTAFSSSSGVAQWGGGNLFAALSSSAGTNISATVGGKTLTAALYATYDSSSENISDKFGIASSALQSLQAQIDSVASRCIYDELTAAAVYADMLTASAGYFGALYGELTGNASTASYLVSSTYGVGSTVKPIYFSGGRPAECAYAFGNQSGNVPVSNGTMNTNLFAQKAQLDSDGYNIASQFTTVSSALQSLQAQIDSVAALCSSDEIRAAAGYFDMLAVGTGIFAGNLLSHGYVTAGAASDARLKNQVQLLPTFKAKRIVMGLRPVTFQWNDLATSLCEEYSGPDSGFIAQEVQPLMPEAVGTIFDEYMRLDYTKIVTPLVGVVQDQERRITVLESKLNL